MSSGVHAAGGIPVGHEGAGPRSALSGILALSCKTCSRNLEARLSRRSCRQRSAAASTQARRHDSRICICPHRLPSGKCRCHTRQLPDGCPRRALPPESRHERHGPVAARGRPPPPFAHPVDTPAAVALPQSLLASWSVATAHLLASEIATMEAMPGAPHDSTQKHQRRTHTCLLVK